MPDTWRDWEGRVVDGKFPLHQYLGASDHSALFLTEPCQGSNKAAIKLICAGPQQRTTRIRNLEVASKLAHPHLLHIFHIGQYERDGTKLLYVVSEYAEESLAQILPSRPLTPAECRELLPALLDVLTYVHSKGLVLSALQPSNIMATGDQLKLPSDRLQVAGETHVEVAPSIYTPPEVVTGGPWTPACDVWSLGVTLVEALTQHRPVAVEGGDFGVSKVLPSPFREIVQHCLERDPRSRWTVPGIVAQLQPKLVAVEPTAIVLPQKTLPPRKSPVAIVAAGLLLAILIGAVVVSRRSNNVKDAMATAELRPTAVESSSAAPAATASANAPGAVAERSLPEVPRSASSTIQGKVKVQVKVSVDPSGKVVASRLVSAGPSKYFANLALRAAAGWKFVPPRKDGQNLASQWTLKYEFARTGTNVHPTQVTP